MNVISKQEIRDSITITRLLVIQFGVFVITSLFLYFYHPFWPLPAFFGGLIAWLPGVIFVLLTQYSLKSLTNSAGSTAISWVFTLAWIFKLIITIILLAIAIQIFKQDIIPLGIGFLSVIMMQFLAPFLVSFIK